MSGVNARNLAASIVARVLRDGIMLDTALFDALTSIDQRQHASVRSLSFGAVRGYYRYLAILDKLTTNPAKGLQELVQATLCIAFYEIEDARTPQYAVVDAAVESAKAGDAARAAGLINAVLRRYLRERKAIDDEIAAKPASCHASPKWLAEVLREDWPGRWAQLLAASDTQAPMWLRVNSRAADAAQYIARLKEAGIEARAEERVPYSVVLNAPCDVQTLPGFAEGLVSVQDLGAQCVMFPLALSAGLKVLDACAAPGGKTALMAEREPQLQKLLALDIDSTRLERVRENLTRGQLQAQTLVGDAGKPAGWWDGEPFDRILLDAPCSALGVIRRHPDIRVRKTFADISRLPPVQGELLKSAWSMLAPGGRLVYATCTITKSENRNVIAKFLDRTSDAAALPSAQWTGWPGFGEADEFGRQMFPGEAGADGFYYAVLTKQ